MRMRKRKHGAGVRAVGGVLSHQDPTESERSVNLTRICWVYAVCVCDIGSRKDEAPGKITVGAAVRRLSLHTIIYCDGTLQSRDTPKRNP